jgi:site-specific DNA recombinase
MTSATLPRQTTYRAAVEDTRPVAVFLYTRISNDPEGRELGVQRQDQDLHEWADREHPENVRVFDGYTDNDRSASTRSTKPRPQYDRLMRDAKEAAQSGRYRLVVVAAYTSGRLTRRPTEHESQIELAEKHGVTYHFLRSPSFDLNTASGRRIARTMAAQDAGEAEDISERVLRAKLQSVMDGVYSGGPPGFGYRVQYDYSPSGLPIKPGRLVVEESEAALIRDAVRRFLAGESLPSIAARWTAAGVSTPRGGAKWNPISVRNILMRIRNAGLSEHRGQIVGKGQWGKPVDADDPDGPWCSIITEDELYAVRAKLNDPVRKTNQSGYERRWLGPGLYRCGQPGCDSTMRSSGQKNGNGRSRYYCREACHCSIDAAMVDAHVRAAVCAHLATHGAALLTKDQAGERERLTSEANVLRGRIEALAVEFGADDRSDSHAFAVATRQLEARLRAVEEAHAMLIVPDAALATIADAEDPVRAFLDASLDRQRAITDALIVATIKPGRRGRQPAGTKLTDRVVIEARSPGE